MVQRLKIVEKERDALETEKVAAEAYLSKQRESWECQRTIFHVFVRDGQVQLWTLPGLPLSQMMGLQRRQDIQSCCLMSTAL